MANNFTQAMRELTGFGNDEIRDAKDSKYNFAGAANLDSDSQPDYSTIGKANIENFYDFSISPDSTTITENMVINGDIKSTNDISMRGQVYGNITTSANFSSSSLVIGNLKAKNASFENARLKGDVALDGHLNVGANSILVGDVHSESIVISGKVKGNLDITENAVLLNGALLAGDVVANDISTESGARINGSITMRNQDPEFDLENEFDFGGDF